MRGLRGSGRHRRMRSLRPGTPRRPPCRLCRRHSPRRRRRRGAAPTPSPPNLPASLRSSAVRPGPGRGALVGERRSWQPRSNPTRRLWTESLRSAAATQATAVRHLRRGAAPRRAVTGRVTTTSRGRAPTRTSGWRSESASTPWRGRGYSTRVAGPGGPKAGPACRPSASQRATQHTTPERMWERRICGRGRRPHRAGRGDPRQWQCLRGKWMRFAVAGSVAGSVTTAAAVGRRVRGPP
mmetsp:Transcript_9354/g.26246  ORF Transcript_9354/g.26246 Transcript_9354/m.26246 type:complete len:239 (+) Transcript_9354:846-1562(+)